MSATVELIAGSSVLRKEDDRLLTGTGRYVDDIQPARLAHAKFVRSPYAHAKIRRVDTTRARALPGVLGVFVHADFEGKINPIPTAWVIPNSNQKNVPYHALAHEIVRYQGEAVAVVVAEDPYIAADARDLVEVDYDPLPVVVDVERALESQAPQVHSEAPGNVAFQWTLPGGDVDSAFKEAEVIVSQRFVNQRLQPTALEPRAAIAEYAPGTNEITLYVTSQNPHVHRLLLALILGFPENQIHVISPDVGGGFGSKIPVYPWEAVLCRVAQAVGRPVKWVEDRSENYVATTHGRDHVEYVDLAAKKDGTILGIKVRTLANLGAYVSTAAAGIPTILYAFMLGGCYAIKAGRAEVTGVFTNTTPVEAYRGAGRPEALYIVERMVDILAQKIGLDAADVRRKNFIASDKFPYSTAFGLVYDSGDYARTFERALSHVSYADLRAEQKKVRPEGNLLGIGLASYVEICGLGPSSVVTAVGFGGGLWGSSTVRIAATGKVTVYSGGHPHGQGEETTFAQIVAHELGIPVEDVDVVHGDTRSTPMGMGTYGSRTTAVEGGSIALSCRKIREKARKFAALSLEVSPEDLEFSKGRFSVKGVPEKGRTIQEVAYAAYMAGKLPPGEEPILDETTFYDPANFVFPFGTHVCVVEVERATGQVRIRRYVAVDDCGPQINPMIVQGQVHGGVLQGLAQAMLEESRYDERGNLLTGNLVEYLVPTAVEAPNIETDSTVTPSPHNPMGVKGIGETGTIAAAEAYVNAVVDALRPFGVTHLDMPLTPAKVWHALHTPKTRTN